MHTTFLLHVRRGLLLAGMVAVAACVESPSLVGPGGTDRPGGASGPRIILGTDTLALYEADTVRLAVSGSVRSAELLVLDSTRTILWRSGAQAPRADSVAFAVGGVPATVPRGRTVFVTAVGETPGGTRFYASADTGAVTELARASLQPAVLYDARRIPVTGRVSRVAVGGTVARGFFADSLSGRVGVVDLTRFVAEGVVSTGSRPIALDVLGGRLAVLTEAGTTVEGYDVTGPAPVRQTSSVLPPLVARFVVPVERDSLGGLRSEVFRLAVRPFATDLALSCGSGCDEPLAFGPSPLASGDGGGVVRELPVFGGPRIPSALPILFDSALRNTGGDTIGSRLELIDASTPTGRDSVVLAASDVGYCVARAAGGSAIAAARLPGGALYVGVSPGMEECVGGVPIVRLERGAAGTRISLLGIRNLLGENRIGAVEQLDVSDDGAWVLARDRAGKVHVLDAALRLRGTVVATQAGRAVWLRGAGANEARFFAVASAAGIEVYRADDLTLVQRLALRGVAPNILGFTRVSGQATPLVVAATQDGRALLIARVTLP